MAGHTEGGSSSFVESLQPDYQCTDESPTTIIHPSSIPLAMEVSELMNITNWQATLDQDGHISDKWEDTLGEPDDTCDASPLEDDEESETESRSGSSYIYRGHWMTVETSLLLILTFATTHSITDVQLSDMLALISLHLWKLTLPLVVFISLRTILKRQIHQCKSIITVGPVLALLKMARPTYCNICRMTIDFEKNKFLNVTLEPQIQNLFQHPGFVDKIQHRFKGSMDCFSVTFQILRT
ncbi:hypothetical protein BSL78_09758 [Apostichopus japonicus]|uniref:Uncharacterized protein n=1 Tax=Stichopus japonicus TaxID=307972 RepID=A0A2G8KZC3_STIJA|nr:hypothetical protein BSL78_09758 [Apostichopus japonicus]